MSDANGTERIIFVDVINPRYQTRLRDLQMFINLRDSTKRVSQLPTLPKVISLDKTDVSPILKQTLTFTLNSAYSDTLLRTNLAVQLLG